MQPTALDPGSYRGTYKLIGGRPSLDFVNTVSWPGTDRQHDWLDSVGNLERWIRALGLTPVPALQSDLKPIVALRASLWAVLRPLAHGHRPTRPAIDELNRYVSLFSAMRVIDQQTLAWTWRPAKRPLDVFAAVVEDAVGLITAESHDRLRHCPACDWLFEDRTRNGQRRWCDMADCGSRDKANRYYHRRSTSKRSRSG